MSLEEAEEVGDVVVEVEGINFILDPQTHKHAKGATVDYKRSLLGKGFVVTPAFGGNC